MRGVLETVDELISERSVELLAFGKDNEILKSLLEKRLPIILGGEEEGNERDHEGIEGDSEEH